MWFIGLCDWFGLGILKGFELQGRECYKQSLLSNLCSSSQDQNDGTSKACAPEASEDKGSTGSWTRSCSCYI